MIQTENFRKWLEKCLGVNQVYEALAAVLEMDYSAQQKLLYWIKGTDFINEEDILQLEKEIHEWELQPLELQYKKRGDGAFLEKRYSKAVMYYKLAQQIVFDPFVEHNIGAAYIHLNYFVEAEKALHLALKHSDVLEIHLSLIKLLKITNRTNEAIARAKDLITRYEKWEVYFEWGTIYLMRGHYEKAFEAFSKAYVLEPQVIILIKMIETSMAFQSQQETFALLEDLREGSLEDYFILKSRILVRGSNFDDALECLEEGLMELSTSKSIPLELSRVCRLKKQIIKAINSVMKAQMNGADPEELIYEMALIAKRAGNRKEYELKIDELKRFWKSSIRSEYTQ